MKTHLRVYPTQWLFNLLLLINSSSICVGNSIVDVPIVGIKFFSGTWKQVLAEAKIQHKPIFLDLYTTWCAPCKQMAQEAFANKRIGTTFNTQFINYRLDAEKGEGRILAKRYNVDSYPTLLFLLETGEVLYRPNGYKNLQAFIKASDQAIALANERKPMSVWQQEFTAGRRDSTFLREYLTKRADIKAGDSLALETLLNLVPRTQWTSAVNIKAISGNLVTAASQAYGVTYDHLMQVRSTDQVTYGLILRGIAQANKADYQRAIATRDTAQLDWLTINQKKYEIASSSTLPTAEHIEMYAGEMFRLRFYYEIKDWPGFHRLATPFATKLITTPIDSIRARDKLTYRRYLEQTNASQPIAHDKTNADLKKYERALQVAQMLDRISLTYAEYMTDPGELNQALAWSSRALQLKRLAWYLSTQAKLLSKLSRKEEAIKCIQEAIALAEAKEPDTTEEDLTEFKAVLAKFNQ